MQNKKEFQTHLSTLLAKREEVESSTSKQQEAINTAISKQVDVKLEKLLALREQVNEKVASASKEDKQFWQDRLAQVSESLEVQRRALTEFYNNELLQSRFDKALAEYEKRLDPEFKESAQWRLLKNTLFTRVEAEELKKFDFTSKDFQKFLPPEGQPVSPNDEAGKLAWLYEKRQEGVAPLQALSVELSKKLPKSNEVASSAEALFKEENVTNTQQIKDNNSSSRKTREQFLTPVLLAELTKMFGFEAERLVEPARIA